MPILTKQDALRFMKLKPPHQAALLIAATANVTEQISPDEIIRILAQLPITRDAATMTQILA